VYAKKENRQPNAIGLNKVVIRPDSGNPVDIICGTGTGDGSPEDRGAIECLWETFGGTETEKGFKLLDEHIGLIYGDSITLQRAKIITERLAAKGFASTNVVFGVGSYTYQYATRDTFGFAMKATAGKVNGEYRDIFKDPKTDGGDKKSAKGFMKVVKDENDDYVLLDQQDGNEVMYGDRENDCLVTVFSNGHLIVEESFANIRQTVDSELAKVL